MASCPKCGMRIKPRKGVVKCKRDGIIKERMKREIKLLPDEYYPLREDLYGALERYLNLGIMPGSFLTAVLENKLCEAFGRADHMNEANMKNIIGYVYNHLPFNSWGSAEKVQGYLASLKDAA